MPVHLGSCMYVHNPKNHNIHTIYVYYTHYTSDTYHGTHTRGMVQTSDFGCWLKRFRDTGIRSVQPMFVVPLQINSVYI